MNILSSLDAMKPSLVDTSTSVYTLLSSVSSSQPEDVQKISLVCFCKQELILLNEKWAEVQCEATRCLAQCRDSLRKRQSLDRDLALLEQWFGRERWIVARTFSKSSIGAGFDKEKISLLKQVLQDLSERRSVSRSYFEQSSKYLDLAEQHLVLPPDPPPCVKVWGDSYLPLLMVTSVILMYSYYYPINWWEGVCRLYHLVAW